MNWALVVSTCIRFCVPQYVELFQTKAECQANVQKADNHKAYNCVVAVKGEKQ